MSPEERAELLRLYKKTGGGHIVLPDIEIQKYAALRQKEFQDRRAELIAELKPDKITLKYNAVRVVKDDVGDIIGWIADGNPD